MGIKVLERAKALTPSPITNVSTLSSHCIASHARCSMPELHFS